MSTPPQQIGPYEIDREIGRGGMGVVYLAHDTRLERDVAIKCLPEEVTQDEERFHRFEREAKTLASLNHPNIATVYGLEEVDDKRYLILEFVDGETLAQIIERGPVPVAEALPVATQIAEAIEAAHEKGVVHRDLKPANIKFSADDQVKVLDFGLAKVFEDPNAMSGGLATSPTYVPTHTPSIPGIVLGTAGYLSPEQARGRSVDKRSDIWSFGCVLFEMLAGQQIFPGETVTDSIGATLHKEPDWKTLPDDTPPTIHLLLRRCLTKDRKRRLHDIADARLEIEEAIADPTASSLNLASAAMAAAAGGRRAGRVKLKVVASFVLGAALTAAGAFGLVRILKPTPVPPRVDRLSIVVPQRPAPFGPILATSPDGRLLAYRGIDEDGESSVFTRPLGQQTTDSLAGTGGVGGIGFSPDGKWIAFFESRTLKKIPIQGGPPTTLCETGFFSMGLTWADDGSIFYCPWGEHAIYRVSENGGEPESFASLEETSFAMLPHALPDAGGVLFSSSSERFGGDSAIDVVSQLDGSVKRLIDDATQPVYASSGHLLFVRESTIMARPFDVEALEFTGPAVPVVENVTEVPFFGGAQFALARDGTLFHLTGEGATDDRELLAFDSTGQQSPLTTWSRQFQAARSSRDGLWIATQLVDERDGEPESDIWLLDLEKDIPTLLTTEDGLHSDPCWSPNGAWIYYTTADPESFDLLGVFRRRADGGGDAELVYQLSSGRYSPNGMTPDGKSILLEVFPSGPNDETSTAGGPDIMLLHLDGDQPRIEPWLATADTEFRSAISPNGRWVAYTSRETGDNEIYVRPFAGGSKQRISRDRGRSSFWSPDGSTLYFTVSDRARGNRIVMAAQVTSGAEPASEGANTPFDADVPVQLFEISSDVSDLSMLPDGERFLAIAPPTTGEEDDTFEIHVTLNFLEELNAKAPVEH